MASPDLKIYLYRWLLQHKRGKASGFTLLELLISLLIAGIIVSGLLFLVVELLRVDRREIALEQVQRDMQRSMDYISDDLREAVYVYSTPTTVTDQLEDLKAELDANNAVPVLAFWRPDEITETLPVDCSTEGANSELCTLLKTRRATYSLVVYYQRPQYSGWQGDSTLKRYELKQYVDLSASGAAKYTETDGYVDPVTSNGTSFESWSPAATDADGNPGVLVDYVDALAIDAANSVDCQALINQSNQALTGQAVGADEYILTPANAATTTGFFACVRNTDPTGTLSETGVIAQDAGATTFRSGQDLYLFLRGDATSISNNVQPASENSRLPVLQTQVLVGGVINKDGN